MSFLGACMLTSPWQPLQALPVSLLSASLVLGPVSQAKSRAQHPTLEKCKSDDHERRAERFLEGLPHHVGAH